MIWETNPMGLHIAVDFGRVKPLRILTLPYQKTKPKGLRHGDELWWFGFICVFTRLLADILKDQP